MKNEIQDILYYLQFWGKINRRKAIQGGLRGIVLDQVCYFRPISGILSKKQLDGKDESVGKLFPS